MQRNVVYRFIVGCIPHRGFSHCIMPAMFDSATHLLFHCPSKEQVWQGVIFEFLRPTTSISGIKQALLSLDFFNIWYCQYQGISPYRILLISLSQIWLAHIRYIFDQVPIVPTSIMVSIRSNVRQTIEEDRCHSLLWSVDRTVALSYFTFYFYFYYFISQHIIPTIFFSF
ncbi:hypothetical protein BD408DRAFT_415236 [Parasitella parasitica]|nr:hypothetical protein BD408DRAFT_415236 [Parasitella parasitica]